jgi:ATP-dependent RNA helicase DDX41
MGKRKKRRHEEKNDNLKFRGFEPFLLPPPTMVPGPVSPKRARQEDDDPYAVADDYVPYVPVKKRKEQQLALLAGRHAKSTSPRPADGDEEDEDEAEKSKRQQRTLLQEAQEVKRKKAEEEALKSDAQKRAEEEEAALRLVANRKKLAGAMELAQGITYTEPLKTR